MRLVSGANIDHRGATAWREVVVAVVFSLGLIAAWLLEGHVIGIAAPSLDPFEREGVLSAEGPFTLERTPGALVAVRVMRGDKVFIEGAPVSAVDLGDRWMRMVSDQSAALIEETADGRWSVTLKHSAFIPDGAEPARGALVELEAPPTAFAELPGEDGPDAWLIGDAAGRVLLVRARGGAGEQIAGDLLHSTWVRFLRRYLEGDEWRVMSIAADGAVARLAVRDGGLVLLEDGVDAAYRLHDAPGAAGVAPEPGTVFRDCPQCPEMVVIPGGGFVMGSPPDEPERFPDEGPQRPVTVPLFAVGVYEVTFAEWDACVADGGCTHRPGDEGWGRERNPVINVSWEDAQRFVSWLNRKVEGAPYRLPSEAEWEYAARAGTTTPFWWGASIAPAQANYDGTWSYAGGPTGEYRQRTVAVGSFEANPFGLHDVHGNVWEWTEDCWNDTYEGAPTDGSAWTSGDCSRAVLRGGSWSSIPRLLRSAYRGGDPRSIRNVFVGFRVARTFTR